MILRCVGQGFLLNKAFVKCKTLHDIIYLWLTDHPTLHPLLCYEGSRISGSGVGGPVHFIHLILSNFSMKMK